MATLTLKVIKTKAFEANKEKHVHYTTAYKGRVFGVSTLRHDADALTYDAKASTLVITGDVEVLKDTSVDVLTGETNNYLSIVPRMDIALAVF